VIQMMWFARLKPLVAVAAALIFATVGVAVHGRQQPTPQVPQEQANTSPRPKAGAGAAALPDMAANQALARKQLALIDEAWALMLDLYQNARIEINNGTFGLWGRRRLEALRKAGAGKTEIVAALEKYINDLEKLGEILKARIVTARGTTLSAYEIQFLRMEAEIWLNEEKAK
jgi:hypothetical protein